MGRHFLDLEAGVVRSQDYALCQRAVADVVAAGAMGIVHGQAGAGKTFAVEDAVMATGRQAVFLGFATRPTTRGMAEELCARLFDFDPGRADQKNLTRLLRSRLDVDPMLVVVDEAQRLNRECFEFLRYLHDPSERGLGGVARRSPMLLVGGDQAWGVLASDPMLRSRIYRRVHVRRLRPEQVLAWMPGFHPLYREASAELLSFVDHHCGHGLFRNWAAFTRTVLEVVGGEGLTKEAAANAFTLLGGANDAS
ncbi:MAG TPA: ATP-binding protein [Acidimicrobiales bacterium]|nr:ATP-binding protein [Acidimicrobiales bacterium]